MMEDDDLIEAVVTNGTEVWIAVMELADKSTEWLFWR